MGEVGAFSGARVLDPSDGVAGASGGLFSATIDARTGLCCAAGEFGQLAARGVVGLPDDD